MATGAIGGGGINTVVGTTSRQPRVGFVAGIAGRLRARMICRFARSDNAIVAIATRPHRDAIMAEFGAGEILGGMAGIASCHRGQMLDSLDHIISRQTQTTGVATGTVFGRTFKYPIQVATFTPRIRVHSRQREAGFKVVKILGAGLCHGSSRKQGQGHSHRALNNQAKKSANAVCHGVTPWRFCN